MKNPYEVIGVAAMASAAEIQSAYRKLAKKPQPDLDPGDRTAEKAFEAVAGEIGRLALPDGGTIDVAIPAGLVDGRTPRFEGNGAPERREVGDHVGWNSEAGHASGGIAAGG